MQFHLVGMTTPQAEAFLDVAKHEGLPMQIFGIGATPAITARGPTSTHRDDLPMTVENIAFAVDLSMQPHLTEDNVRVMGRVILEVLDHVLA